VETDLHAAIQYWWDYGALTNYDSQQYNPYRTRLTRVGQENFNIQSTYWFPASTHVAWRWDFVLRLESAGDDKPIAVASSDFNVESLERTGSLSTLTISGRHLPDAAGAGAHYAAVETPRAGENQSRAP
jgi:hypothetical protein